MRKSSQRSILEQEVPVDSDLGGALRAPPQAERALARFAAPRLRLAAVDVPHAERDRAHSLNDDLVLVRGRALVRVRVRVLGELRGFRGGLAPPAEQERDVVRAAEDRPRVLLLLARARLGGLCAELEPCVLSLLFQCGGGCGLGWVFGRGRR